MADRGENKKRRRGEKVKEEQKEKIMKKNGINVFIYYGENFHV
jgi:hypothetical protein